MSVTHKQLDLKVDTQGLKKALNERSDLFGKYPYRGTVEGSPHSEMEDVWIRYKDVKPHIETGDFSSFADEHDSVWYDAYYELPEVKKPIFDIMSKVNGERLGGVLITKLPSGGKINAHVDGGWHAKYYDKYYVPIQNEEGSIFAFEGGIIKPEEGDVYWFDNSKLHWVENNTSVDRIAMIVCIKTEDS